MTYRMILVWTLACAAVLAVAYFDAARAMGDPSAAWPRSCAEWAANGGQGPRIVENGRVTPRAWACADTPWGIELESP